MVDYTRDVLTIRGYDSRNRHHIPAQPLWIGIVHIAQMVIACIVLILTVYAAERFAASHVPAFGLCWFTAILTCVYTAWLGISLFRNPQTYNYWAQLVFESLCTLFWLLSWSLLASEIRSFDGWLGFLPNWYYDDQGSLKEGYGYSWAIVANDCIKVSTVLGIVVWVSYIVTLVMFARSLASHRKSELVMMSHVEQKAFFDQLTPVLTQERIQPEQTHDRLGHPQDTYHQPPPPPPVYPATYHQQSFASPDRDTTVNYGSINGGR